MNNQPESEVTPMNPPARLCCGQPHSGPICNDGKVMCCLCFQRFSQDELSATNGQKEDVCLACAEREKAKLKEKEVMPVNSQNDEIARLPSPETAQAGVGAEDRQITTAARGLVQRFENQCDADLSLADIMWLIGEVRTAITTALAKQQEREEELAEQVRRLLDDNDKMQQMLAVYGASYPTDEQISKWMKEDGEGKRPLSGEAKQALKKAGVKFQQIVKAALKEAKP